MSLVGISRRVVAEPVTLPAPPREEPAPPRDTEPKAEPVRSP